MNTKNPYIIKLLLLLLIAFPSTLLAGSIGDAAENLMGPTSIVMKLVEIGCYLIGLAFVMMSIAQYKIHRQSPKLVPLATPITLLILGVIALFIPYTTKMAETGKSEVKQEESRSTLPLPGQDNTPGIPFPPGHQNQQQELPSQSDVAPSQESQSQPNNDQGSSDMGGWEKYNRN